MPVRSAANNFTPGRRENLIFAILFGALCTVTDCSQKKIDGRILLAGGICGIVLVSWQLWKGIRDWYDVLFALLPGALLWGLSFLAEGKIGRGDGNMVLILGLLLNRSTGAVVLLTSCLLTAIFAGAGLAVGKLRKNSRIPFAPFLLSANLLIWILESTG